MTDSPNETALNHGGAVQIVTPIDQRDQLLGVRLRCLEIAAKEVRLTLVAGNSEESDDPVTSIIGRAKRFEAYVFGGESASG